MESKEAMHKEVSRYKQLEKLSIPIKRFPFLFRFLKRIFVKLLRITRKDIDFFYDKDFATNPIRNKSFCKGFAIVMIEELNPRSVIDFGCGTADILLQFERRGITVLGIDGSKECYNNSLINPLDFIVHDLRKEFKRDLRFELCMCLGVAEHIEERYADTLIESLVNSSDTIIFTPAFPGEDGLDHCNLKPSEYWIQKFNDNDYYFDTYNTYKIQKRLKEVPGIFEWYHKNMMIFKKL